MPEPTAFLHLLRASTADLLKGLDAEQWSDADVRAPSLCDAWTRGHVLTHVARNADSISATLGGALRGEIVARYPDWDARTAAIEEGSSRPVATLLTDVADSAERLDRVIGAIGEVDGWGLPTDKGHPAEHWLFWRCREVEIHRVDLAGKYTPERWPPLFVSTLLPDVVPSLEKRAELPVQVTVTAPGSLTTDLVGRTWTSGEGERVDVAGPDWAVLAWLVGRPSVARDALSAAPELGPWS